MERRDGLVTLSPEDYFVLGEEQFGVPGLIAHEIVGPFVRVDAAGPLIMVHDGRFEPRHGIGHHPHRMNERLFYITEGEVTHDDVLNDIQGHMGTGDVGCLTEGYRGMLHKEWNDTDGPARAFILVYGTDPVPPRALFTALRDEEAPRYEPADGVRTKELVGEKSPLVVRGDIRLFTDDAFDQGAGLTVDLEPGEGALLYADAGRFEADGTGLGPSETLLVAPASSPRSLTLRAAEAGRLFRVVHGPGQGLVVRE
jgi:redox-sensitive bicupin YhaK (pirin superfamily)